MKGLSLGKLKKKNEETTDTVMADNAVENDEAKATKRKKKSKKAKQPKKEKKPKPQKTKKQIQQENERKYLRNGEDYYPYSSLSFNFWKVKSVVVKAFWWYIAVYAGIMVFAIWLYPFVQWLIQYLKAILLVFQAAVSMQIDLIERILDPNRIAPIVSENSANLKAWALNLNPWQWLIGFVVLWAILYALYLWTVAMRRHEGELEVMTNDRLARRSRNYILKAFNVKSKHIKKDENGNYIEWKTPEEQRVREALRAVQVSYHTRRDVNGKEFHRKGIIWLPQPINNDVRDRLLSKLKDAQGIFTASTKGIYSFSEAESSADRRMFVWKATVDITKEVLAKLNPSKQEEANVSGEWGYPLGLLKDNTASIDDQHEKAVNFANKRQRDVEVYLASTDNPASYKTTDVGNTSVSYRFEMANRGFDITKIETELRNRLKQQLVQVTTDSGDIIINIPLPDDCKIPIDMRTIFESIY